jgi:hypothetical protein
MLCLPFVIHGSQHQPTGITWRHDPNGAHAELAKACTHARDLRAGSDHDDHVNRLPQC